jgi:hypothetical protein
LNPPQTVYLSGRTPRRLELRGIAAELRAMGFEVVSLWHEADVSAIDPDEWAWLNADAIAHCDAFLMRAEPSAFPLSSPGHGGRHVELGMAYAAGRLCAVVGRPEHPYHRLPGVLRYRSWEPCLAHLAETVEDAYRPPGPRGVVWPEGAGRVIRGESPGTRTIDGPRGVLPWTSP